MHSEHLYIPSSIFVIIALAHSWFYILFRNSFLIFFVWFYSFKLSIGIWFCLEHETNAAWISGYKEVVQAHLTSMVCMLCELFFFTYDTNVFNFYQTSFLPTHPLPGVTHANFSTHILSDVGVTSLCKCSSRVLKLHLTSLLEYLN